MQFRREAPKIFILCFFGAKRRKKHLSSFFMLFHAKRENKIKYFLCIFGGKRRIFFFVLSQVFFGQFMFFWPKIKYFYAFFICFFRREAPPIFKHFLYAFFAAKRWENFYALFLCFSGEARKKQLYHCLSIYAFLTKP